MGQLSNRAVVGDNGDNRQRKRDQSSLGKPFLRVF
jgi:hypothetical protein